MKFHHIFTHDYRAKNQKRWQNYCHAQIENENDFENIFRNNIVENLQRERGREAIKIIINSYKKEFSYNRLKINFGGKNDDNGGDWK